MSPRRNTPTGQSKSSYNYIIVSFCTLLLILSSVQAAAATVTTASRASKTTTCAGKANRNLAYVQNTNSNNNQEPQNKLMRAWMCHGNTHKEMVGKLASAGIVKSHINIEALTKVDRKNYVLKKEYAYQDSPQPIGYGATISAPHMHAHVLEDLLPPLLQASKDWPEKDLSVLDVGCGSGYLTAVFGRMVQHKNKMLNSGKVIGIDVIPQLVELSNRNMRKEDGDLLDEGVVELRVGDGWKGYPEGAPYNAIHVGAAAETFPRDLMNQMAVGGVMVIPVGPDGGVQYLYRVERVGEEGDVVGVHDSSKEFHEDDFKVYRVLGVRYVPLVRAE